MGRFGGMKQHLVSRLRFIAVMLFVGLFSSSLQAVETKTMKYDAPGCKSREDANKVLSMIAVQDFEAMSKFLALRGATGDCVILNGGQELYVQEHASSESVCVRPKSEVDCYWVIKGWMKP
jgi:hypothetical protein